MSIAERYALEAPLEQGRFGTVYRASDLLDGTTRGPAVAVWVLPPELANHGPALAAFRRDLERVSELRHPNIARVLDVGQDGNRMFVATESTDGATLRGVLDALRPETLDPGEADEVVESLGAALLYAHERGIVHGDVRLENVLVTEDQRIKLANFAFGSLARSTPFAPALRDDTRALAAVAHELYTGEPPSPDSSSRALATLPKRRRDAITSVLAAPVGKAATPAEFLRRAGLACDGRSLPLPASPSSARRRVAPRDPRRRRFALLAGALALGAVIYTGDAISWWRGLARPAKTASDAADVAERAAARQGDPQDASTASLAALPSAAGATYESTAPGDSGPAAPSPSDKPAATARKPAPVGAAPPPAEDGASSNQGVQLSAKPLTVRESQRVAKLEVMRSGDVSQALDFVWWTTDGTAHAGDDYASFGHRVESFARGETKHILYIPLASDSVAERPESFFVHIAAGRPTAANAAHLTAEIRIVDDDR